MFLGKPVPCFEPCEGIYGIYPSAASFNFWFVLRGGVNKKKEGLNAKNLTLKKEAKKVFDVINNKKFKFSKRTKDNDELYGSIKPKELSKAIENIEKIEIRPSQIDLGNEINKVGSYEAKINLHAEIFASIHIEVVKEKEEN